MSPEQEMADAAALKHQIAEVSDPGIWKCFGSGCWGFQMQDFIFFRSGWVNGSSHDLELTECSGIKALRV